jgi:hypothetical protein
MKFTCTCMQTIQLCTLSSTLLVMLYLNYSMLPLSRSDLWFVFVLGWSGRELVGLSMFRFLCCVGVWPGMVSCLWKENHTQVAFSHLCFVGVYFPCQCFVPRGSVSVLLFHVVVYCFVQCSVFLLKTKMNTYHAACWSDPCYSSSEEEEENRYIHYFAENLYWP